MIARLRFLSWLAARGLFDRPAGRTTSVSVATVAIVLGLTLSAVGLTLGVRRVNSLRIERDPLSLCLFAGGTITGRPITEHVVKEMDRTLRSSLPGPGAYRGCYPFREVEFTWRGTGKSDVVVRLKGRTFALGDPLLSSRPVRGGGRPLSANAQDGLIASPKMLAALGLPSDRHPDVLVMESPSGRSVQLPVLGVTRADLPLGHLFVVTESFDRKIQGERGDQPLRTIRTGDVPVGWPEPDRLPDAIRELLRRRDLRVFLREAGDRSAWIAEYVGIDETPVLVEWTLYLREIERAMQAAGFGPGVGFARPVSPEAVPAPTDPGTSVYDWLGIYVGDLAHLPRVADACRELQLPFDRDVVDQVSALSRRMDVVLRILVAVVLVVSLIAGWNLSVIQALRAEHRMAEIGILKAIGMDELALLYLSLTDGLIIWALGFAGGLVLGTSCGRASAAAWYQGDPAEASAGFDCPAAVVATVALISALICLSSAVIAGTRSRHSAPYELLRTRGP